MVGREDAHRWRTGDARLDRRDRGLVEPRQIDDDDVARGEARGVVEARQGLWAEVGEAVLPAVRLRVGAARDHEPGRTAIFSCAECHETSSSV